MASWRDTTSQQAQDDLDGLLDEVLPFAEQTIAKYGEMFPFGAAVTTEGERGLMAADPGAGDQPRSQDVLTALYEGARQGRDDRRAVAFAADVLLEDGSDAVRVELEHREGVALMVFLPYTRGRFRKTVSFGQMTASLGERRVWAD